jgi:hypothetical protein
MENVDATPFVFPSGLKQIRRFSVPAVKRVPVGISHIFALISLFRFFGKTMKVSNISRLVARFIVLYDIENLDAHGLGDVNLRVFPRNTLRNQALKRLSGFRGVVRFQLIFNYLQKGCLETWIALLLT